ASGRQRVATLTRALRERIPRAELKTVYPWTLYLPNGPRAVAMALSLSQAARDAEEVAAGLQVFEDNVRDVPELHLCIRDLVKLAERLRALDLLYHPELNSLLIGDVDLLLSSLQY